MHTSTSDWTTNLPHLDRLAGQTVHCAVFLPRGVKFPKPVPVIGVLLPERNIERSLPGADVRLVSYMPSATIGEVIEQACNEAAVMPVIFMLACDTRQQLKEALRRLKLPNYDRVAIERMAAGGAVLQ